MADSRVLEPALEILYRVAGVEGRDPREDAERIAEGAAVVVRAYAGPFSVVVSKITGGLVTRRTGRYRPFRAPIDTDW